MMNPFQDRNGNDSIDEFIDNTEEGQLNNFQYYEKNEKCGICLDEIKDKFTLFCGDFFCRECIVNLLEESINNIKNYDIVHIHEHRQTLAIIATYFARKNNIPYIVQAHGSVLPFFQKE